MIALLLAASLCLPPGIADPKTLVVGNTGVLQIEHPGHPAKEIAVTRYLNPQDGSMAYNLLMLGADPILVDDHPSDTDDTHWWADGGLITDDLPPKLQPEPHPSCQWHRRGEKT